MTTTHERKKISSIDPATCSEVFLYFLIDTLGGFIWRMNHTRSKGHIPDEDWPGVFEDVCQAHAEQKVAVGHIARFGVPTPILDDKGVASPEYWEWFHHWDNWKKGMSDEQWARVAEL